MFRFFFRILEANEKETLKFVVFFLHSPKVEKIRPNLTKPN